MKTCAATLLAAAEALGRPQGRFRMLYSSDPVDTPIEAAQRYLRDCASGEESLEADLPNVRVILHFEGANIAELEQCATTLLAGSLLLKDNEARFTLVRAAAQIRREINK